MIALVICQCGMRSEECGIRKPALHCSFGIPHFALGIHRSFINALRRARSSLSALAERAPRSAHIWRDEELINIPAEQVEVGMVIVVKPGELVPVDGVVTSGSSSVSEADLTGEPVPVRKAPGMLILSGSVNLDGVLEIRASKRSAESKYAQIVHLVEEAQTQKAPIHRLAYAVPCLFRMAT